MSVVRPCLFVLAAVMLPTLLFSCGEKEPPSSSGDYDEFLRLMKVVSESCGPNTDTRGVMVTVEAVGHALVAGASYRIYVYGEASNELWHRAVRVVQDWVAEEHPQRDVVLNRCPSSRVELGTFLIPKGEDIATTITIPGDTKHSTKGHATNSRSPAEGTAPPEN